MHSLRGWPLCESKELFDGVLNRKTKRSGTLRNQSQGFWLDHVCAPSVLLGFLLQFLDELCLDSNVLLRAGVYPIRGGIVAHPGVQMSTEDSVTTDFEIHTHASDAFDGSDELDITIAAKMWNFGAPDF